MESGASSPPSRGGGFRAASPVKDAGLEVVNETGNETENETDDLLADLTSNI